MSFVNAEIKARCKAPEKVRSFLISQGARFSGTDHQTDTYFRVPEGRLKLREGNIEKALIWYHRADVPEARKAEGQVWPVEDGKGLKEILKESLGILTVVKKTREIYFLGNIKIHIDEVPQLGNFVEIEAQDHDRSHTEDQLLQQCRRLMHELGIMSGDIVPCSYSDMLLLILDKSGCD